MTWLLPAPEYLLGIRVCVACERKPLSVAATSAWTFVEGSPGLRVTAANAACARASGGVAKAHRTVAGSSSNALAEAGSGAVQASRSAPANTCGALDATRRATHVII